MKYVLKVKYNSATDEYYIILPPSFLKKAGWKEGDIIDCKLGKDGCLSLYKK